MKKFIKRSVNFFRNFRKYLKKGGIVYLNFSTIQSSDMLKDKHIVIVGG